MRSAALALAVFAACTTTSAESPDMSVALTVFDARVEGTTLVLHYTVQNPTAERIHLTNLLPERGAAGRAPQPDKAYVRLDGDVLVVRKAMALVPDDLDVEVPEVPYLTELPAGGRFEETFRLAVPVAGHDPYVAPGAGSAQAKRVRLEVGVVTGAAPQSVSTVEGTALWLNHRALRAAQRVLTAEVALDVATLLR